MRPFVALGMCSGGNDPKNVVSTVDFPSRQCSSTLVGFGQWYFSKEQFDYNGASPILSWPGCNWLYLFPWLKSATKERRFGWCYWNHKECDGGAENVFTKWLPLMFPTPLQSLAEVYSWTKGLIRRKCSLNNSTVFFLFSEIKWTWNILKLPRTVWIRKTN